jgi:hypothetical protein
MQKNVYADELGNIYSNKTGIMKPLKPQKVNNSRSKKQYWMISQKGLVHRLVASAYLGDVTGKVINHIDGNPSNNEVTNLEIVTQKENCIHASKSGLVPRGKTHGKTKYSDALLIQAIKEVIAGSSVKATAIKFGINVSYLNRINNKKYRIEIWDKI